MRLVNGFIIAIVILFASPAVRGGDFQYFITGGVAYPVYDKELTNLYNAGLHLGIGLGYTLTDQLMLLGNIQISNLPLDKEAYLKSIDAFEKNNQVEEGSASVLTGSLNLKYSFSRARSGESLFLTGGATVARFIAGDILFSESVQNDVIQTVIDGKGQSAFGLNAGAGFNVHLSSKSFLFFEARYTVLFTDKPRVHIIPLQFGVAFR
ncbi:MAG: outer membrane beta-barrel protein [bacterium]|nr:outer membrane beta-barrel protein [bacterium]